MNSMHIRRTLEWAHVAAWVAEKDSPLSTLKTTSRSKGQTICKEHSHNSTGSDCLARQEYEKGSAMDVVLTDNEDHRD